MPSALARAGASISVQEDSTQGVMGVVVNRGGDCGPQKSLLCRQ
jgi:hypothetical protein